MKTLWTLLLLIVPLCANALGVKEIEVFSALNQPLNARIGLVSAEGLNAQDIKVSLAKPKIFKDAGIARPYFLTRLSFKAQVDKSGKTYIQISSRGIVREPYLDFMIEVNWRGGSLIKEFTVLLDPITIQKAPIEAKAPVPVQAADDKTPETKQIYGPVKKAETLWVIAKKTRPSKEIPIQQMIMAIHKENPKAFVRGNVNLLKQGATLTIPNREQILGLPPKDASKQYREQEKAWVDSQTTVTAEQPKPQPAEETSEDAQPEPIQVETDSSVATKPEEQETIETEETQPVATDVIPEDEQAKLQVIVTPESQLKEIPQTDGNKAYPKGEIEQLRESIADTKDDVKALEAINQDLVRLRGALKSKIALVQEELNKTNEALAIVTNKLGDTDTPQEKLSSEEAKEEASTKLTTPDKPVTPKMEVVEKPATLTPETPKVEPAEQAIKEPATDTAPMVEKAETKQPAGAEVKTDLAEIARIKKLEAEIESLKSQGNTLEIQKYMIIALAAACLLAFAFIILSNRKTRPKSQVASYRPNSNNPTQFPPPLESEPEAPSENIATTEPVKSKHLDMPFDSPQSSPEEKISFKESPVALSNKEPEEDFGWADDVASEQEDDLPSPKAILYESGNRDAGEDVDSILTTVDVYLAYRRISEAESILHDAIAKNPDQLEVKAKLLEIYAFKKDTKLFTKYLEQYQAELSSKAPGIWDRVLNIGAQLIPSHPYIIEAFPNRAQETASDTSKMRNHELDLEPDSLVDELVIGDVETPEDDLFKLDNDESEPFDIDLDLDDLDKK